MLCDTGPLVALLDADDPYHVVARQTTATMTAEGWLTTWACVTEAMHLLGKLDGHRGQGQLWEQIERGLVVVHELDRVTGKRLRDLMDRYSDAPMDFADATLVVLAEQTGDRHIFTFDHHFRTYLIRDQHPFDVIP